MSTVRLTLRSPGVVYVRSDAKRRVYAALSARRITVRRFRDGMRNRDDELKLPFAMAKRYQAQFTAKLFRYPGKGGWTFATVPERFAPPVTHGWGRTPVMALVDGYEWKTSVWREKTGRTLLAVPKAARGTKGDGDVVQVRLEFSTL